MKLRHKLFALGASCILSTCVYAQAPDTKANQFVDELLRRMTATEKIEQMEQAAGQQVYTSPSQADALAEHGIGSFLFFTDPVRINQLQRIAVTKSRMHIPILFGYDVIHGFRTQMPIPLAMASSWDPPAVERAQSVAALEARANGVQWAFTPMVDIARDPRWGRIMEGAGEDPYLGSEMAAAQVRGLQGTEVGAPDHILACVKHFAGYGGAEGGRDYDSSDLSDDLLYNVYLKPYQAAVDAHVACVMSAYMDLNSIPASGNEWLLRDVLRKQWGFKGFVVTDWETIPSLQTHGFAASPEDAALRAFRAGNNIEMESSLYRKTLPEALKRGDITMSELDAMVRPVLMAKYNLGLFDHPYVDLDRAKSVTLSDPARTTAREMAEDSAVLLRNEGHLLPLSKSIQKLAVIGPMADSKVDPMGSWAMHGSREDTISIAQGLRDKLPHAEVSVTVGTEIERTAPGSIFNDQVPPTRPTLSSEAARSAEWKHALDLAKDADTVIMVLGELQDMSGERASRASLQLPGRQQELLEQVVALGKPVVLVLMTGRPLNITWASEHVPAILNAWYPGTEAGHAVANLLLGDANPSGHLPLSWPRDERQIPVYYNHNLTQIPNDRDRMYWDESSAPLYPFGYGLSYSDFTYSDIKLTSHELKRDDALGISIAVKNQSATAGADVIQVYFHQRAGGASRPVRELKAFRKVILKSHQSEVVRFEVPIKSLSYWNPSQHHEVLDPGDFDVWVGSSSAASLTARFRLIP